MNRSSKGCWTCRIRHRKCDEKQPICHECSDRSIPCHGYGAKPKWMADEWKLQAELSRMKRTINSSMRRKKKHAPQPRQSDDDDAAAATALSSRDDAAPTAPEMTFREAQLLVHYLDYIFPLQYPYYKDEPSLGGRGWLFWLLMKRGPLHQAVLTLSALHHHTQSPQHASGTRESELIEYHTNALQRLRRVLGDSADMDRFAESRAQMVEFLACGCALISFELFRGGLDNWQPHLHALTCMVNKLLVPPQNETSSAGEDNGVDKAQPFLVTKVLWLDILASTATGTAPQTRYREWLTQERVDMSRVMGCRNWVMRAIGDVASVSARSRPGLSLSGADELQLRDIEQLLETGIEEMELGTESRAALILAITKIFATAALVQVETVAYPRPSRQRLYARVSRVVEAIEGLPHGVTYRGLAWPIATAGAVAASDQQGFFERTMREVLDTSGSGFTNCGTVLDVLRQCWQHQAQTGEVWTWQHGMQSLGICALLL